MVLFCWSFLMGSWLERLLPEAGLSCPVVPATCPVVSQDLCCLSVSPVVFQQPKLTSAQELTGSRLSVAHSVLTSA